MAHRNQKTRDAIISVAGPMFGELGYGRVSGKQICEAANVNPAAINYYFHGMEGLFEELVAITKRDYFHLESLADRMRQTEDPERKLFEFVDEIAGIVVTSSDRLWMAQLSARELVSPSPFGAPLLDGLQFIISQVKEIAAGLAAPINDEKLVSRLSIYLFATTQWLLIVDRPLIRSIFPSLSFADEQRSDLTQSMYTYVSAGCRALCDQSEVERTRPRAGRVSSRLAQT